MRTIKIEKGIEIPSRLRKSGKPSKYPFAQLEVGESFLVRTTSKKSKVNRQVGLCSSFRKYAPKRFTSRTIAEGVRIWRIE